ncbi:MAG TPA: type II secretion system protein [Verrucomicrobiae bacterium]|nr:type II secretion system protein [Verrucomicrobiae bacterium]
MKPRLSNQRNQALTLTEVLVVIILLVILAVLLLPILAAAKHKSSKINCASCLRQIGLAYREWEGDNGDKFPMQVSVTNGGAMESVATGNVFKVFQVMSNELSTPKVLICPRDTSHVYATNFETSFDNSNISYFTSLDAIDTQPQMILSGDDNFEISGVPIKSGLLELSINSPIAWTKERHNLVGNILFVDGSVLYQVSIKGLQNALQEATNRLAIP